MKTIQRRTEPKQVSPQYVALEKLSLLFQDVYNSLSSKQKDLSIWYKQLSDIMYIMEKRMNSLECFANNVRNKWGENGNLVEMICPNCGHTFQIPKEEAELDDYISTCKKCWSSAISPQNPDIQDDIGYEERFTKREVVQQLGLRMDTVYTTMKKLGLNKEAYAIRCYTQEDVEKIREYHSKRRAGRPAKSETRPLKNT